MKPLYKPELEHLVGKIKADLSSKQDKLTAGDNITITNNTISATDTVYDDTFIQTELGKKADKANEHTHDNKSTIDKFSEVEGKPYYNGEEIGGAVPNLTLNELILGDRFKIVYNDIEDSLDIEVI